MTPEAANRVALSVVRRILGAAHAFEPSVAGKPVRVSITSHEEAEWPKPIPGLVPDQHGAWPSRVNLRCDWDGGSATLQVSAIAGRHEHGKVVVAIGECQGCCRMFRHAAIA